ncbi:hypothetical protein GCM10009642_10620 [Nocardiopsis metallicus]
MNPPLASGLKRFRTLPAWVRAALIVLVALLALLAIRAVVSEVQFRIALAEARDRHPVPTRAAETWWNGATEPERVNRCAEVSHSAELAQRGQLDEEALTARFLARDLGMTGALEGEADRYREMSVLVLYCGRKGLL